MSRTLPSPLRIGLAAVLTCLLLGGCGKDVGRSISGPDPGPGPGPVTDYGDPSELVAWLTVAPTTFHQGEVLSVEVGVRNPTSKPILFNTCFTGFWVSNENGPVLGSFPICAFGPQVTAIDPGQSLVSRISWDTRIVAPGKSQVHNVGFVVPVVEPVAIEILEPQTP